MVIITWQYLFDKFLLPKLKAGDVDFFLRMNSIANQGIENATPGW